MTTQTEVGPESATAWYGILPQNMGRPLAVAGISPDNVEAKTTEDVIAIPGCGWGTARRLAREGFWLNDLPEIGRDCAIEMLQVPLAVYIKLKDLRLVSWFDFIAHELDGASLIAKGFTISQVTVVRQALDTAGTGFADLSGQRTLGQIRFDAGVTRVLAERGIQPTLPLRVATIDFVLELLGPDLAALYQDRIFHAYWRVGYDSLGT
jgi:hypothetical protein